MLDTAPLRDAYRALLDAAAVVADSDDLCFPARPRSALEAPPSLVARSFVARSSVQAAPRPAARSSPVPPAGEWNADQVLAHVAIVTAATIAAACSVASGANATYDNRIAHDTWTIERLISRAGGSAGLRDRVRRQADSLCALGGSALSEAELDTPVPTLLLSRNTVLVDQLVPLRDLITGLADVELPGHTKQILSLLPDGARP